ncbi:MAG: methyl-accepting chemotaxis protein, partial [Hyphomicrobiales bacterium]|nr:methyl-accepting chemotaxis protein [Hyphomicrobiales bacterium]
MAPPPPGLQSPRQLISRLSVRTRIIALAVLPVVGFLANGIAFTAGERDVGQAFQSAQRAAVLADA